MSTDRTETVSPSRYLRACAATLWKPPAVPLDELMAELFASAARSWEQGHVRPTDEAVLRLAIAMGNADLVEPEVTP